MDVFKIDINTLYTVANVIYILGSISTAGFFVYSVGHILLDEKHREKHLRNINFCFGLAIVIVMSLIIYNLIVQEMKYM